MNKKLLLNREIGKVKTNFSYMVILIKYTKVIFLISKIGKTDCQSLKVLLV